MAAQDESWIDRPVHETEVDGVRVLWRDAPPPLHAALKFRVGVADESFVTLEITHVVEHLACHAAGRWAHDVNGHVGTLLTEFTTSGRAELVAGYLEGVCRALSSLPLDRVRTELGVLAAEDGGGGPLGALLGERLGAQGAGLLGYRSSALTSLTAEEVGSWAAERFVRGNALLALSGPPPDTLRLPLPDGPLRPPPPVRCRPLSGRVRSDGYPFVALGLLDRSGTPAGLEAFGAAVRILGSRVERLLRHERGTAYDIDRCLSVLGTGAVHGAVSVDVDPRRRPEDSDEAVRSLVAVLDALTAEGPTDGELASEVAQWREAALDPRDVWGALDERASDELVGLPALAARERLALVESLGPADVRAALGAAAPAAVLVHPDPPDEPSLREAIAEARGRPRRETPLQLELERGGWHRAPASTVPPVSGRPLKRKLFSQLPQNARVEHERGVGVSALMGDQTVTARWADVVGVGVFPDGEHLVQVADGAAVPLSDRDWRGLGDVLDDLRAHVPQRLLFPQRDDG